MAELSCKRILLSSKEATDTLVQPYDPHLGLTGRGPERTHRELSVKFTGRRNILRGRIQNPGHYCLSIRVGVTGTF